MPIATGCRRPGRGALTGVARGEPAHGYPHPWSVYRWIDGRTAGPDVDLVGLATALADFLVALQRIDASNGPPPGPHNSHRGGPLSTYADETLRSIDALGAETDHSDIDWDAVLAAWDDASATTWLGNPMWVHGDVAAGNLLVRDGRLAAVIDFGCCGIGDPACDMAIAWTLFSGPSRDAFRNRLTFDPDTWARGRGWAFGKALITLVDQHSDDAVALQVIGQILADRTIR